MSSRFASSVRLPASPRRSRRGATAFFVVGALALIGIVIFAVVFFTRQNGDDLSKAPLLKEVIEGPYDHVVLEQGEVESSNNVEIRCEIRSRSGGTGPSSSIIDVIPEGTIVKQATPAAIHLDNGKLILAAAMAGEWGNALQAVVDHKTVDPDDDKLFNLTINQLDAFAGKTVVNSESFPNVSIVETDPRFVTKVLAEESSLVRVTTLEGGPADGTYASTGEAVGEFLITFDSSNLEQEMSRQRIVVNTSEAIMIQAKATYDTAVIAKDEYINGAYNEQSKMIQNEIFVAKENLKKAQLSYESIKRLVSRGLLTSLQLDGERFRVDAAQNELDLAEQKLDVLEKFTLRKMVTQLDSDIAAAEVKWKNEQDSYKEEQKNLKEIEDQLLKCRVVAPAAGQVVYANVTSSRSGSEFVVEAGVAVRERQVILRLPDPEQMQIRAKINESRINLVREGLPVTIRIDAFGDKTVQGEVTKVNKYAEPGNFWSSSAKEYVTLIKIMEPPPEIRVGLTAEVSIHIEHSESALQMPVTAVYEQSGKTFCLVQNGEQWDTRAIVISSTNSQEMAALDVAKSDPIKAGEMVVMNPRKHLEKFDKSRFPKPSDTAPVENAPAIGAAAEAKKSASQEDEKKKAGGAPNEMIQRLDSNSDGKVTMDELPEGLKTRMANADTNGDGELSAAELTAAFAKLRAAGGGPPGGGPPGGGPPGGGR